jgi:hypothetical protein
MDGVTTGSLTPILDLATPLPLSTRWDRLNWRQVLLIVGAFVLVFFLVLGALLLDIRPLFRIFDRIDLSVGAFFKAFGTQGAVVFFFLYFITVFLTIAVHELGHVTAGRAVGFSFEQVRIGPFTIAKSPQGLKFLAQRVSSLDGIAGMRINGLRKVRKRLAIYITGGPFASLLSGLCVSLFFTTKLYGGLQPAIRRSFQFFVAFSVFLVVLNLTPFLRRNGMFTDGARLLSLANSRLKTRRWLSNIALKMQIESGIRLRDLKQTWIAHSCAISDQSLDALQAFWTAYLAAIDRGDADQAAQHLEKCLQRFGIASRPFQQILAMEAAIFHAWFRDDEQRAKIWSVKYAVDAAAAPLLNRHRLLICLYWTKRQYAEATLAWERGHNHIETLPPGTAKDRLRESWLQWKAEMAEKRAARELLPKS